MGVAFDNGFYLFEGKNNYQYQKNDCYLVMYQGLRKVIHDGHMALLKCNAKQKKTNRFI